jgi:YfiR/HmsC-like
MRPSLLRIRLREILAIAAFCGAQRRTFLNCRDRLCSLRWRCIFAVVSLLLAQASGASSAPRTPQAKPEEYQVKAVYLYNFARFVAWPEPAEKEDTFPICVLGGDPFDAVLDSALAGEAINNRKLVAKRLGSVKDAKSCRILFIGDSEASRLKEILSFLDKSPVLTVSDMSAFVSSGGMIEFVMKENKVRFEVNLTATERAGLNLSSQLLKVASDVKRESGNSDAKP